MGIEKCQDCKEPFKVWEHKLAMPGTKEKEAIRCPHCGFTIERMCNGWWVTDKLSNEELKAYKDGKNLDID